MNIAMYMPGLRPESMSWSIYQAFAGAIRAHGAGFTLLSDDPGDGTEAEGVAYLPVREGGLADRLVAPLVRNRRFLSTERELARFLAAPSDIDLLYMEIAYPWAAAAALARRRSGWPGALVVTPMGEDFLVVPDSSYGFARFPLPRRALASTLRSADGVRFISPLAGDHLATTVACPTAVVPLNVAPETIAAGGRPRSETDAARRDARREVAADTGFGARGLVLSLGRLHPFKGLHVLVDAMAQVPDADLVIVGPSSQVSGYGDYARYLQDRAAGLGIGNRIHVAGSAPHAEVLRWMGAADVLAVPSHLESMNRVCVEAAAAGTPFVVTETTGVSGYLTEPGVGITVPPRDPTAVAQALTRILDGRWSADHDARQRFISRFDARNVAPQLLELLERAHGYRGAR